MWKSKRRNIEISSRPIRKYLLKLFSILLNSHSYIARILCFPFSIILITFSFQVHILLPRLTYSSAVKNLNEDIGAPELNQYKSFSLGCWKFTTRSALLLFKTPKVHLLQKNTNEHCCYCCCHKVEMKNIKIFIDFVRNLRSSFKFWMRREWNLLRWKDKVQYYPRVLWMMMKRLRMNKRKKKKIEGKSESNKFVYKYHHCRAHYPHIYRWINLSLNVNAHTNRMNFKYKSRVY